MSIESKGRKAREILESEVYLEAESRARQSLKDLWEHSKTAQDRESLWHQLQAIGATRRALSAIAGDGDVVIHQRQRQEKLNG